MGCDQTGKMQLLLDGELDGRRTRSVLDHARDCEQCREHLVTASDVAPTATRAPGEPIYQRYSPEEIETAREAPNPGKRRGFMALIMVAILMVVAGVSAKKGDTKTETEADHRCREALAAGRPWPVSPTDDGGRPRQIRCVLPSGSTAFALRISKDGAVTWEGRFATGEPGVEIYATTGGTDEGTYEAVAAFAPFPSPDRLPLAPGEEYEYRLLLDSGAVTGAVTFTVVEE
ncbi:MAG: zf-HC2 domain-containing protein [Planctomycetes bacterium]|nr:zf-HC2 domain-containing protein [Planctomycetota bacterium]